MSDLTRPSVGQVVTHHVRVRPPRRMKAISGEVEVLLNGFDERTRRSGALLASELVAQVVGRASGPQGGRIGLTVQLRENAARLEATGPSTPPVGATAGPGVVPTDPLAGWGLFILDRLSDRWGMGEGAGRNIWAEIR
jgi:anti-sigma regulatory factor (Ser/Thr protein kinase)